MCNLTFNDSISIGNTPEFKCKNTITNASEYLDYATNVSTDIQSQGCDVIYVATANVSSTRKSLCMDGYEFEGPQTAVTEVIHLLVSNLQTSAYDTAIASYMK